MGVVGHQAAVGGCGAVAGVVDGRWVGVVDHLRGPHVVEETAPLVEGDDEHRVVQVARTGEGVVGVGDEPFAAPDVGLGVVVTAGSVVGEGELGVDEADIRKQSLGHGVEEGQGIDRDAENVGVASGKQMPERVVLQAPQRQEWQIPEEVTAGGDALVVGDG